MSTFNRGLDDEFVELLNEEYDRGGWWREFVDDSKFFLAVRENYVNVYYRGCSLLKWGARDSTWKINYKYLLDPNKEDYVEVDGRKPLYPDDMTGFVREIDTASLKKAAEPYAGLEKTGVHEIILANKNVLDVEITLGRNQEDPSGRIDLVVTQEVNDRINLVFFEAKHFANPDLRAEGKPKVLKQVERYARMLHGNRDAIRTSYLRVCSNLTRLHGLAKRNPKRHATMKRIVNSPEKLVVDETPRLIVFDFDEDQKNGKNWKPHRKKLKDAIGNRLLLRGSSKEFRKGISID